MGRSDRERTERVEHPTEHTPQAARCRGRYDLGDRNAAGVAEGAAVALGISVNESDLCALLDQMVGNG